nr:MAG TPA: hypothetical protein [Caudoviricetes sp.]
MKNTSAVYKVWLSFTVFKYKNFSIVSKFLI